MSSTARHITLKRNDEGVWIAIDEDTGVGARGKTRTEALEELDEAVALYKGEAGESVEDVDAFLEEIGIEPDELDGDRELPEFLQ